MLNISVVFLTLTRVFTLSPLFSISNSQSARSINLDKIHYHRFVSPIFFSNCNKFNLNLQNSVFTEGVDSSIKSEAIKDQEFSTRQNYKDIFSLVIDGCTFKNIQSTEQGGAFCVISEIHTLQLRKTRFIDCSSSGEDYVADSTFKISAGAFLFTGSKALVTYCCFSKCFATGNTKTFHITVGDQGQISIRSCYLAQNGKEDMTKGHSLFSINTGSCQIYSINSTQNFVPKGYAGGFIGGYASAARIIYSIISNNTGESIYGMAKRDPQVSSTVRSTAFLSNNATKYGVYMRLASPSRIEDSTFFGNVGNTFYGNTPIALYHCTSDSDKPSGLADDRACQWNVPVLKMRRYYRVPCDCNVSKYGNIERKHAPRVNPMHRELRLRRFRMNTSISNSTTLVESNNQTNSTSTTNSNRQSNTSSTIESNNQTNSTNQ